MSYAYQEAPAAVFALSCGLCLLQKASLVIIDHWISIGPDFFYTGRSSHTFSLWEGAMDISFHIFQCWQCRYPYNWLHIFKHWRLEASRWFKRVQSLVSMPIWRFQPHGDFKHGPQSQAVLHDILGVGVAPEASYHAAPAAFIVECAPTGPKLWESTRVAGVATCDQSPFSIFSPESEANSKDLMARLERLSLQDCKFLWMVGVCFPWLWHCLGISGCRKAMRPFLGFPKTGLFSQGRVLLFEIYDMYLRVDHSLITHNEYTYIYIIVYIYIIWKIMTDVNIYNYI